MQLLILTTFLFLFYRLSRENPGGNPRYVMTQSLFFKIMIRVFYFRFRYEKLPVMHQGNRLEVFQAFLENRFHCWICCHVSILPMTHPDCTITSTSLYNVFKRVLFSA